MPKRDVVVVAWSAGCASGEDAYTLAMVFGRNDLIQGGLPG